MTFKFTKLTWFLIFKVCYDSILDLQELQRKSKQMQNDFSVQEKEYRQQKEERKKQLAGMQRSCREKVKRTNSDAYEM